MKKLALTLLSLLLVTTLLVACVPAPAPELAAKLATPTNSSEISSLTPTLSWSGLGGPTSYRLQVASDSNFQQIIIDSNNLTDVVYNVSSGKLKHEQNYYWRVNARKGSDTSEWSDVWSFKTPSGKPTPPPTPPSTQATIQVMVTLDGAQWSGGVNYRLTGPDNLAGGSAPQTFSNLPEGEYAITYRAGGPTGASLASITPAPAQQLDAKGIVTFTLNFHTQTSSSITVNANVHGLQWSGPISYTISGPYSDADSSVPKTLTNLPGGTYTLTYNFGGPQGMIMTHITPSPVQNLPNGGALVYTFNFIEKPSAGNILINATLDGKPWSGPVEYTISGPITDRDHSVPQTLSAVPDGIYALSYNSGGPNGARMMGITPQVTQTLRAGGTITYNLNFASQQTTGTIRVEAMLDGQPWQTALGSGAINFSVVGPATDSGNTIPETFSNQPSGRYTCQYNSGGPIGATFSGITPAPTLDLAAGGQIVYVLHFHKEAKGTVVINATLNGQPWNGAVAYVVQGPYVESGGAVPQSLNNAPAGNYAVTYRSGGPPQSTFEGVSPPSQALQPGGSIAFTLMFQFQSGVLPPPEPEPEPGPLLK